MKKMFLNAACICGALGICYLGLCLVAFCAAMDNGGSGTIVVPLKNLFFDAALLASILCFCFLKKTRQRLGID